MLEATLVVNDSEIPTYEAVQVPHDDDTPRPWWKRHQKLVYGSVGLLILGAAVAVGLALGLRNTTNDDDSSTAQLSSSSVPSLSPSQSSAPTTSFVPTLSPTQSAAPTQDRFFKLQGQGLYGKAEMDLFGGSAAMSSDGKFLAVAAGQMGNNGPGEVTLYAYNETENDYTQQGNPIVGEAAGDAFGYSVALSGDGKALAIGAPFHQERLGQVKVYMWNETAADYTQVDTFYGELTEDSFAEQVVLSSDGSTLAVGASGNDLNGENSGQVKVYRFDEAALSFKQVNGTLNGENQDDRFAYALSLSADGDILVVGAPGHDANGVETGQAKIYAWDEESLGYKQIDELYGSKSNNKFGWSVSLSADGETLAVGGLFANAVGAPFNDEESDQAGQVYVYKWDDENYKQIGQTLNGDRNRDDFGASISLAADGETLIVGAPMNDGNGFQSGQAQVYALDDAGNFTQLGESLYGVDENNYFGGPVVISSDGKTFAVGAIGNNGFSGIFQVFIPEE
jgi:hypothetical protein